MQDDEPTIPTHQRHAIDALTLAAKRAGLSHAEANEIARNAIVAWHECIAAMVEHRVENFGLRCDVDAVTGAMVTAQNDAIALLKDRHSGTVHRVGVMARRSLEVGDVDLMRATLDQFVSQAEFVEVVQ